MKVFHVREGKEMKIPNALTFMANDRVLMTDAVAGDIIGIYNHGQLHSTEIKIAEFIFKDLNRTFLTEFLQALVKLLGFERIFRTSAAEKFRSEVWDAGKAEHFALCECVADVELKVVP